MNPDLQNNGNCPPLDPGTLTETLPSEPANSPAASQITRSPRGKIGRLPKATRDKINVMLRDGMECAQILAQLGDQAKDVTPKNVSNWHTSPSYQHWLLEQDWLDKLRADQESAFDLLTDFDVAQFNSGALQLAVTRLFLALRHPELGSLDDQLGGNARTFGALVHALSRACRETTNIQKYRDLSARAASTELKKLDVERDLSDQENQLLYNKMDQIFKVRRRRPGPKATDVLPTPAGSTPEPNAAIRSPDAVIQPSPHLQSGGLTESSRRSESAETSGTDLAMEQHPEGMPDPSENLRVGATTTEPAIEPTNSEIPSPGLESKIAEHCLECENPLPALLPTGGRPTYFCQNCQVPLPPPGTCQNSSIEQCPDCTANLPRVRPNGQRPTERCHQCGNTLPLPAQDSSPGCPESPESHSEPQTVPSE